MNTNKPPGKMYVAVGTQVINTQSVSLLKILYPDLSIWKRDWTKSFSSPTNVADCIEE